MFALSAVAVSTTLCTATGETVEFVNDYLLERAAVRVGYHFLKVGAVVVRSRARFVGVNPYNSIALTFGVLCANAYLPLNRLLVLSLRGIAGIDNCCLILWALFYAPIDLVFSAFRGSTEKSGSQRKKLLRRN